MVVVAVVAVVDAVVALVSAERCCCCCCDVVWERLEQSESVRRGERLAATAGRNLRV